MNIEKIEVEERFGHSDKEKAKGMDAYTCQVPRTTVAGANFRPNNRSSIT